MKTQLKRIIYSLFLGVIVLFIACETEESLHITQPEATFKLNEPSASNIFLNISLPDNPAFTITWEDGVTGSSSYAIEMATDTDFTTAIELGASDTKSFSMTVASFNEVLAGAGVSSFSNAAVFMRVLAGSNISNAINFTVNSYPENNPVITAPDNNTDFTLSDQTSGDNAITVEWDDPDFSETSSIEINYILEATITGNDFATIEEMGTTQERNLSLTHAQLNDVALNLGLNADSQGSLDIRVRSVIQTTSTNIERISEPITITLTPYSIGLRLSTWGIVGGATPNSWDGPDIPFIQSSTDGVLVAFATLTDGEIKFRENNDWTNNYGDDGADGTLEPGGANIVVTAGSYKVVFNINNLTYSLEPYTWGIVGSAALNSWDGPDFPLVESSTPGVYVAYTVLADGEIKFRENNDWTNNYGDDGADGTLEPGGANIAVTAGTYKITFNTNDLTYSLEPYTWGVVGGATPNSWDGPDIILHLDYTSDGAVWYNDNIGLVDGEIKFRLNNDWGLNYGDDGVDGTLEPGGANIAVTAGNYSVSINLVDLTYTLTQN